MNGMDAHTHKHTQARYGEGARTGRRKRHEEGSTKDGQRERSTQRRTRRRRRRQEGHPPPSLYGQSMRGKVWEHNKQVCHRKRNTTATATDKHTMVWHEG